MEIVGGSAERNDELLAFALYFDNVKVAETSNGVITEANFTAQALEMMRTSTLETDMMKHAPAEIRDGLFNMSHVQRVHVEVAHDDVNDTEGSMLPRRQNYYMRQVWVQVLATDLASNASGASMFKPYPCIKMFNLVEEDQASTIDKNVPLCVR